ncbi:MAG: hypothetical protein KJO07_05720 [Deltaproteobacteria bacterium]|nr:hypothetical protein [Deltaproteobacteria bacterium]
MSDSRRRRSRRVGDLTRQKIDDLADGWAVPKTGAGDEPASAEDDDDIATNDLDEGGGETGDDIATEDIPTDERAADTPNEHEAETAPVPRQDPEPARAKRASSLPPPVPARAKRRSSLPPPTPERSKRASSAPPGRPKRESAPPPPPPGSAARAQRQSEPPATIEAPIERRSEWSDGDGNDSTATTLLHAEQLRAPATLRRKRGLFGDALYVKSFIFGVAGDKRQLAAVTKDLAQLQGRRDGLLVELAKTALGNPDYDDAEGAREGFAELEEERGRRAGVVAASEEDLSSAIRAREADELEIDSQIKALESKLGELGEQLKPIEKKLSKVRRQAADLKGSIDSVDKKIKDTESQLVRGGEGEADIQAQLAALKADRDALVIEKPAVAKELEELEPERNQLVQARDDASARIEELGADKAELGERTGEITAALEARLAVERRAVADSDSERDKLLVDLGALLYDRKPAEMRELLVAVERLDGEIETQEQRRTELDERLTAIDYAKLARGVLIWLLVLGAIVGGAIAVTSLS